ncbi:hypothetical protein DICPUDRAFT_97238 [Dictyostelium purpureum]|uniref:Uncharacterized protein n=1 Tax=Dictyostelium purpureum TaxID=5786 RepID=F0ZF01_DICPU|nr:uncharacterized protein DICPUDRAFT_97238 [Dictyostelium purpureum]EGC37522.1 hypothetical protein DICPUDRAFT_97238 [Dictyostelium purpureum]|eukprot:XP_003285996.1 hypothetical protein DICPUDRAFT_97238 [Dictyostelium purpureum]
MLGTRKRSSPPLFNDNSGVPNSNNNSNGYISPPSPLSPKQTNQFLFNSGLDYNNYNGGSNNNNGFTKYQPQTTSFVNNRLNQFSLVSDSEQYYDNQQQASSSTSSSPTSLTSPNLLPPLNYQTYQYIDENDNSNINNNHTNNNNFKTKNKSNIKKNNKKSKVKRHINFKLDDGVEQQNQNQNQNQHSPSPTQINSNDDDEFYETNTDFGYLNVSTKEDLLVCLNVLKKEMGQFKNLSHNLLSRLNTLERGIGQEKQLRLNGDTSINGHSRSGSDQDSFENNQLYSPNFLLPQNSSNNNVTTIQQEILISTCLLEIQKIIEKQRTYDSLLAQREKYWDIELNKLTMQILNKLNNGQHLHEHPHHHHHQNHLLNSPNSSELQTFHHDQEFYPNNNGSVLNDEMFDSYTALNNINNSIVRNNSSSNLSESNNSNNGQIASSNNNVGLKKRVYNSFKSAYVYLFGTKKTITFWKKAIIIGVIVVLWPLVANLVYKLIMYIVNKRRLAKQSKQLITNNLPTVPKLSSTLKPLKSLAINNSNNSNNSGSIANSATSLISSASSLAQSNNNNSNNNNIVNNNVFKKIKSSILSSKKGGDLLNSNSSNNSQIRAPDIVKAFIQGVSTGDGGSTNNSLTSLTNTLGNLNPAASIGGSIGSNSSGSGSGNSIVSNTSSLLSNGLNSLTSSAVSSSFSPSSTSLASMIIPNSTILENNNNSNNISNISNSATNAIRNGLNRVSLNNNSNNNTTHNEGLEGNMIKIVRNLLSQR